MLSIYEIVYQDMNKMLLYLAYDRLQILINEKKHLGQKLD